MGSIIVGLLAGCYCAILLLIIRLSISESLYSQSIVSAYDVSKVEYRQNVTHTQSNDMKGWEKSSLT